jgi:hypothetical protein
MRQFSIKNDQAVDLLERITQLTGEGKTEAVIKALELYETRLTQDHEANAAVSAIKNKIHPHLPKRYRGKAPSKAEIEAELGMP